MIHILVREARRNKKWILFYLTACIVVSVLLSPLAGKATIVRAADVTLSEGETVDTLIGMFTGKSLVKLSGSYSQVVGVSAEPFTALLLIGLIENINRWVGSPMEIASTPAGNPIVLILVFLFFAAGKIMKSNEATQVFGMVTLGELEKYLGLVFLIVLGILNVAGVSTAAAGYVNAADIGEITQTAGNVLSYSVSVVSSIIMGLISLIVYYIVKTAAWGLDALQVSLSFIPGSAFVFELLKTLMVFFLVTVNVLFPKIGFAINVIIFIVCCICFQMSYTAMRYFKKIYLRPMWKQFGGFEPEEPLIHKHLPKKIKRNFYPDKKEKCNFDFAIPVYALKPVRGNVRVKRYDRWWFIKNNGEIILCKNKLFHKQIVTIPYENTESNPIYLRKDLRFFEIFNLLPDEMEKEDHWYRKRKRHYSFAFSKEYKYRFEDILTMSAYTAYADVLEEKKQLKKQLKEEKKELRRARKAEKKALR